MDTILAATRAAKAEMRDAPPLCDRCYGDFIMLGGEPTCGTCGKPQAEKLLTNFSMSPSWNPAQGTPTVAPKPATGNLELTPANFARLEAHVAVLEKEKAALKGTIAVLEKEKAALKGTIGDMLNEEYRKTVGQTSSPPVAPTAIATAPADTSTVAPAVDAQPKQAASGKRRF